MNWFMSTLTRDQRRWYAGLEANRIGKAGARFVSEITGLCVSTIQHGRAEVTAYSNGQPEKSRRKVGRRSVRTLYPDIDAVLESLLADEIAGDPMCKKKWVRRSSRQLSKELSEKGYKVNYHLVCDLLKQMGYSMKVNVRHRASTSFSPRRDTQFEYIKSQKDTFLTAHLPVISVDTKKKELIGNFKANGRSWCKDAREVSKYRFASMAQCVAVPYGIYDLAANRGYMFVGTSTDSPEFAVTAIRKWWSDFGCRVYASATRVLILADGGGSNGARSRAWKKQLQTQLSDGLKLEVTVSHYPPGCSKYNPVERRLFSPVSMNWQGRPLETLELMLGYIRGTTTNAGLTVEAFMLEGAYPRGERIAAKEFEDFALRPHDTCPEWNYSITPR